MASRKRKQIYIEPAQEILLKRVSDESGVSEAELIRQAITLHLTARRHVHRDKRAWEAERAFIAQRMSQGPLAGGRQWRRDDLYER